MYHKNIYKAGIYATVVALAMYLSPGQRAPAKYVLFNRPHGRLVMVEGSKKWENRKAAADSKDIILQSGPGLESKLEYASKKGPDEDEERQYNHAA